MDPVPAARTAAARSRPALGGRQVGRRAGQARARRSGPAHGGQPHADHAAQRDAAVQRALDAAGVEQRQHVPAQVVDGVGAGRGGRLARGAPWPRCSYRSSRKCRASTGTDRSQQSRLVPRELPSTSTGAPCGPQLQPHREAGQASPGQTSKKTVSCGPCSRMSNRNPPGRPPAPASRSACPAGPGRPWPAPGRPRWPPPRRRSRSGSPPGPAARGRTPTRPGAAPRCRRSGAGNGPGRSVTMRYRPSASVAQRPKPRKPAGHAPPRGSSGWAKLPSGSACQVSTSASGTGSPGPVQHPAADRDRARRGRVDHVRAVRPRQPDGQERADGLRRGQAGRLTVRSAPPARTRSPRGRAARCPTGSPAPIPARSPPGRTGRSAARGPSGRGPS